MLRPSGIASLYAVFATLAVLLLGPMMPPMQNGDEAAHSYRADQVSHFGLLGMPISDGEFGGDADSGLAAVKEATAALPFHVEHKVTRAMVAALPWGAPKPIGYPNTAVNPPFFYAPAALMAVVARSFGVALPHALVLMRMAGGFASVAVGAVAIASSGNIAIWMFSILLLPMSMSLSAAITQDGLMSATAGLAAALYIHTARSDAARKGTGFLGLCVLLAVLGMSRAPYAALALLALTVPLPMRRRLAGFCSILVVVLAWSIRSALYFPPAIRANGVVSPFVQLTALALHPWRLAMLAWRTLPANDGLIGRSFIGQLGWLDVDLPGTYRIVAWAVLLLAAAATWRAGTRAVAKTVLAGEGLAVAGAVTGVAVIQYLTWTVVGSPVIEGIQGRYFLVPALFLGVLMARPQSAEPGWTRVAALPVLAFPTVSLAVTVHAVLIRYYF